MVGNQSAELPDYSPLPADRPMEDIAGPYQDIVAGFQSTMADICSEFESTLAEATEAMKELLKDVEGVEVDEATSEFGASAAGEKDKNAASPAASPQGERPHSLRVFDK